MDIYWLIFINREGVPVRDSIANHFLATNKPNNYSKDISNYLMSNSEAVRHYNVYYI